jgi:hypothetical protein
VVAVDRLVEDPLHTYYGYKCEAGLLSSAEGYDKRCDLDGDGVSETSHSWVDEDRVPEQRSSEWWADQNDDVAETIFILVYRGEDVDLIGGSGDLTAGAWVVHRTQRATDSDALIIDTYFKMLLKGVLLEFEGLTINGTTRALTLPASGKDPLRKDANILGYVGRAGYVTPGWKALFETGYASGDEDVVDREFTGRPLHPDHNVGLLLYEEVLAHVTAATWTQSARGLWSNGGVYNSRYIFPTVHLFPLEDWEVVGGFLTAWPDRPDGAVIQCNSSDKVGCDTPQADQAKAKTLGWELDLAVKHRWHKHVLFSLEAGVAKATDRLPLESTGLNPEGKFFTVQSRLAWEF